jgi:hypothetical protein
MNPIRTLLILAAVAACASSVNAQAQQQPAAGSDAARWSAWLGCWTPAARSLDADTQVCIVPAADGRGVRMLTFAGDREVLAETIVADGSSQPAEQKDCTGSRQSRWAESGPRLFSSSSLACAGQPEVKTTGISALVSADRWVDVQVASTGGREQVRTRRFWRSSAPAPAPIAERVRQLSVSRPVVAAINVDDVIEASHAVAAVGVEAWLAESGARVPVNRRALVRLSDAAVDSNVIDLMVAVAFPKQFEVRRAESSGGGGGLFGGSFLDGYSPGEWGSLADVYGFGFGSLGLPYYYPGYNGYYQPGGFYFVPPSGGAADDGTHGRVVNGQGYTRIQPREAARDGATAPRGGAQTATGSGSADGGGGSSASGPSSGASPAGYSGGGGSSSGLTAVPR